MCMRPLLADSTRDSLPEGLTTGVSLATKAAGSVL